MNTLSALRRFATPLAALVLGASFCVAAESDKNAPTASFRFLRFAELPDLCAKNSTGKYIPIEAHTGFIGRPVRISSKDAVSLIPCDAEGAPLKKDDKPVDPLVSFTPLPQTPRQLVVLFSDAKKAVAKVIPDNPAKFPFGRVLAVNLTDKALVMEIGGSATKLPAVAATLCDSPGKFVGDDNTAVRITTAEQTPSKIYSTVWPFSTEVRTLAFIYKNESGRVIVRTVTDANVPELAEAKPDTVKPGKGGTASDAKNTPKVAKK